MIDIFLFLQLFLMLMPMNILGVSSFYISIPLVISGFFLTHRMSMKICVLKKTYILIFSFSIILAIIFLSEVINSGGDYDDLLRMCSMGLAIFFVSLLLVHSYIRHYEGDALKKTLQHIILVGVINAIITLAVLLDERIRTFIYSFVMTSPKNEVHLDIGMRSSGLFYFGGSVMSMFNCIIVYMTFVYYSVFKQKENTYACFIIVILISGIFVSGRMGLVATISILLVTFLFPRKFHLINKKIALLVSLFFISGLCLVILYDFDRFQRLLSWALELFINYINNGQLSSASTSDLETMYKLPSSLLTGTGVFSQEKIGSDSGYILLLFYFGIIGLLAYVFLFLLHALFIYYEKVRVLQNLTYFTLLVIVVGNFKDIYLFASNGVTQIYFLLIAHSIFSNQREHFLDGNTNNG